MLRTTKITLAAVLSCLAISASPASAATHRVKAKAATVEQATNVFHDYARKYCGNGLGVCLTMYPVYCTGVGNGNYYCNTNWLETNPLHNFRTQAADGHANSSRVLDFWYWTT